MLGGSALAAAPAPLDFNRDIQPILSENCYHCHGPDKANRKAGLRLDTEKEAKTDHDGVLAIKPGHSSESDIIKRILSTDPDEVMPTPKSNRKLTEAQKQMLQRWIDEGAKWGVHWAFEKPQSPAIPAIAADNGALKNPIDSFVLERLTKEGVKPSPEAPKATLVRRVTLDLTGLPPTPEEVADFLADDSPQAYERIVDRLLKSPGYGERMAWDWLDAARYADTNGYQGDPDRTMWPWRDWVVRAFNENMPYDQFTIWQLAGDVMPNATTEQKLASAFNRNHMMNGEGGRIPEETRVENVMDRVDTTATLWMGLTMGCARCHDHKFDPLAQKEYYALYDFFNQTSEDGKIRGGKAPPVLDMSTPAEDARLKAAQDLVVEIGKEVDAFELQKFPREAGKPLSESEASKLPGNLSAVLAKVEPAKRGIEALLEATGYFKDKDPAYEKLLQKLLSAVRASKNAANNITNVMVMDTLGKPRESFILAKGSYDKPMEKVSAGTPAILSPFNAEKPTRLDLAQWLVRRDHPLTARVTVNRYWQTFFGVGLVKTVEDFGVQGEKPSHPGLLDWLAVHFMESGWDVKVLCKLMVMSATYRQSSKVTPDLHERDPENRLMARGSRYRLPSWIMRDQALAASGLLDSLQGGGAVKPYQPEGIWEEATFGIIKYKQDHGNALYRRSLYTFWRRIVGPTMFFDNSARQVCDVRTLRTNTPLHALTTLNDISYVEAARVLAQRVLLSGQDDAERLNQLFVLALARPPLPEEKTLLMQRLDYLKDQYAADEKNANLLLKVGESPRDEKLDAREHAAWTALCQLVLNLDEAISKE